MFTDSKYIGYGYIYTEWNELMSSNTNSHKSFVVHFIS